MQEKNTLSVRYPYSDKIVCVEGSFVSYVDDAYYKTYLNEDYNDFYTNFPVKMAALRVDWIITKKGKKFLQAICNSENQEIFNTPTILVIIEFLYFKHRNQVLRESLPFYIIQLLLFFISIMMDDESTEYAHILIVLDYINIVSCFYTLI